MAPTLLSLSARRTERAEQRRLLAELASYRTPSERAELAALLARQSDDVRASLSAATGGRWAA